MDHWTFIAMCHHWRWGFIRERRKP